MCKVHDATDKVAVKIEYCTKCRWLLRAAWLAQELLFTFEEELAEVRLAPADVGCFRVMCISLDKSSSDEGITLWDRKAEGRFPEAKELKQRVRDAIAPSKSLGHSESKA